MLRKHILLIVSANESSETSPVSWSCWKQSSPHDWFPASTTSSSNSWNLQTAAAFRPLSAAHISTWGCSLSSPYLSTPLLVLLDHSSPLPTTLYHNLMSPARIMHNLTLLTLLTPKLYPKLVSTPTTSHNTPRHRLTTGNYQQVNKCKTLHSVIRI